MAEVIRKSALTPVVIARVLNQMRVDAVSTNFHRSAAEVTITADNASDLATSLTLVNQIARVMYGNSISSIAGQASFPGHYRDTVAHKTDDTSALAATYPATNLATAQTLANEIKSDYATHRASTTYHYNADGTNTIAAADATDQSSLNTLLNELKTDLNAHMASSPDATIGAAVRIVND